MLVKQIVIHLHTSTIYSRREQTTMAPALTIGLWGFSTKKSKLQYLINSKLIANTCKLMIFFIPLLLKFNHLTTDQKGKIVTLFPV